MFGKMKSIFSIQIFGKMRRNIILVIAITLLSMPWAKAQIWTGPKIGGQTSRFYFADAVADNTYNEKYWWGANIGWVANFEVEDGWSLATDFVYARKGRAHTAALEDENIFLYQANYGFIDASALLRYSLGELPRHYYINVGPVLSFWTDGFGRIETDFTGEAEFEGGYTYNVKFKKANQELFEDMYVEKANRLQVGIEAGIGMQIDILYDKRLQIDLRYQMMHTHMGEENSGDFGLPGIQFRDNFEGVLHTASLSVSFLTSFEFIEVQGTRNYLVK